MLQFYFLSILLNLVAGLIFIYATNGENQSELANQSGEDSFSDSESSDSPEVAFDDDLGTTSSAASDDAQKPAGGLKSLAIPFLGDKTLQLVVGILVGLTGIMKLLSPIQYDIAIIGDLIPALAGIAASAFLLLDWYQDRSDVAIMLPESIESIYTGGRKYLGIFCVIAAVLHFIFPRVLFL